MNSDIYMAVVDALLPELVAIAAKREHELSYQSTTSSSPEVELDLLPFKKFSKVKKINAELVSKICNAVTLFCRDSVKVMIHVHEMNPATFEYEHRLKLVFIKEMVRFREKRTVSNTQGFSILALGSQKTYKATDFGLHFFELPPITETT
jgi:hypothetical protein